MCAIARKREYNEAVAVPFGPYSASAANELMIKGRAAGQRTEQSDDKGGNGSGGAALLVLLRWCERKHSKCARNGSVRSACCCGYVGCSADCI